MGTPVIAFIERETPFSGKAVSTRNLAAGIEEAGFSATISTTVEAAVEADFYAATCLEDADLLAGVPDSKRVIWLRGNPVSPGEINIPDGGGRWIATSQLQADRRRSQFGEIFVLPESIIPPPQSEVMAVESSQRSGLLFVGRVERRKGMALLFTTLKLLPPTERLTIIGPYGPNAVGLAQAMKVEDRVEFLGYLENSELSAHYFAAKCLLAPCRNEPFGMPIVEALAHGCTPIAAVDSGGPDEILGGTPYLVHPSPDTFSRAVLNCAPMAPEKSQAIVRLADYRVVANQFLEFLHG